MKDKYIDAIAFFDQSTAEKDKDQVYIAVKEFQMFRSIYHDRMQKYLEFDPDEIEDEVYQRLSENTKKALSNQDVLKELAIINVRRASRILECDEMNRLNFQMFQYALNIFQKEKKKERKAQEEEEKRKEALANPQKKGGISMKKLIFINLMYFLIVGLGIMYATGRFNVLGVFGSLFT